MLYKYIYNSRNNNKFENHVNSIKYINITILEPYKIALTIPLDSGEQWIYLLSNRTSSCAMYIAMWLAKNTQATD